MGTPSYMAPEVSEFKLYRKKDILSAEKADVFSLGITLYEGVATDRFLGSVGNGTSEQHKMDGFCRKEMENPNKV